MAFSLSLATPTQSNDALTIHLVDNSNWGTTYSYPDGITYTLSVDVSVKTFSGTTTFDTITSSAFFNSYSSANKDFSLTGGYLKVGGVAYYTDSDLLPDGIWTVVYKLLVSGVMAESYTVTLLVLGQIIIDNNIGFVDVPNVWHQSEMKVLSSDIMKLLEPLRKYTMRKACYSEPYVANETKMLNMVECLTRQISNLDQ